MNKHRTCSRFALLHAAALALTLIGATAYADPAPPATTGAPPAATSPAAPAPTATNPAPVTPPAPIVPAPGAVVTAPGARREETEGQEQPPAPAAPAAAGLFDRAISFMQTKDGLAAKIAGLQSETSRLEGELAKANATIAAQNTELGELRAGKEKIEAALGKIQNEQTTVSGTVAALGFQAQSLPPQTNIEASGDTEEELLAQFRAEPDAKKKGELAAKLRAVRDKAA